MKRFLFPFLLLLLFLHVFLTGCSHIKADERFMSCREAFCVVTDRALLLENGDYDFNVENQEVLSVFKVTSVNQRNIIDFSELEIRGINTIRKSISYDFSFIRVTDEAIFFGGIGPEIYVYSKTGNAPSCFLDVDCKQFKSYEIDENWYRLLREGYYLFP